MHQVRSAVEGTPVSPQPLDDLEHQVEGVVAVAGPLGDLGPQADAGEDRLDRIGRAQMQPGVPPIRWTDYWLES